MPNFDLLCTRAAVHARASRLKYGSVLSYTMQCLPMLCAMLSHSMLYYADVPRELRARGSSEK